MPDIASLNASSSDSALPLACAAAKLSSDFSLSAKTVQPSILRCTWASSPDPDSRTLLNFASSFGFVKKT